MRKLAVAAALALAAAVPAAGTPGVTWTDPAGDANGLDVVTAPASVAAYDILASELTPYLATSTTSGVTVSVTLADDPLAYPGSAIFLEADQGDCHIKAQWSAALIEGRRDEVTRTCPSGTDYVKISAYASGRTVVLNLQPTALADSAIGAELTSVVVATAFADPVFGFAPPGTQYDWSYLGVPYVLGS